MKDQLMEYKKCCDLIKLKLKSIFLIIADKIK